MENKRAVLFNSGDYVEIKAGNEGIRFILLEGKPLNQPIAWDGPVVMNTKEELNTAFKQIEENTFINHNRK